MRIIAIEEHYSTPLYRQKVSANELRSFYMTSRSEQIGHDIGKELDDLGETRLQHMDAAGVDLQVLSFNGPVAPGFPAGETIAMAKDANDRLAAATKAHPKRFAGFAALPTAAPEAAADELERCVKDHRFVGAMIHGHTMGRFLDDQQFWPHFPARGNARRADLSPSGAAESGRDQGLFRRLRGHPGPPRLGLRRRHQHPFPAHPVLGRVRRLSEAPIHHGPSGRRACRSRCIASTITPPARRSGAASRRRRSNTSATTSS